MPKFTHFNSSGDAHMVDIADKTPSKRIARAAGCIVMQAHTLLSIIDNRHQKGDVLAVARIAGIMASKRTAELIPLCHSVPLTRVSIEFEIDRDHCSIECFAQTETLDRTGVEMEAFCAVQVALTTIYDMCKAVDRGMHIENVRLLHKSGGKSDDYDAA